MAQKIKGGRAAIDRLLDGLRALDDLLEEIGDALLPPNIRLIEDDVRASRTEILELRQFITNQLDPMLIRREQAQTADEQAATVAALAADVADLRERLAVLERSRIPERRPEGR